MTDVIEYVNTRGEAWSYPMWQQLIHQVNHATQHRSEVAVMLTESGVSPGDLDFLVYQDTLHHNPMRSEPPDVPAEPWRIVVTSTASHSLGVAQGRAPEWDPRSTGAVQAGRW